MLKHFLLVLSLIFSPLAFADWKPTKTIEVTVPFPPGSGNDLIIRPLIERVEKNTGAKFIVVNRPGGGGTVGTTQFSKKQSDDHAIAVISVAGFAAMDKLFFAIQKDTPYTLNNFDYVMAVGQAPCVITTSIDDPVSTPKELHNVLLKEKVVVADSGAACRLGLETLLIQSGARDKNLNLTRVEHKGPAETAVDVIGKHVRFGIMPLSIATIQARSGKLKIIAATNQQSIGGVATVSSISPNVDVSVVWGIVTPAGVSKDAVNWYAREFTKALNDPSIDPFYKENMFFKPSKNLTLPEKFKEYVYGQEKLHQPVMDFIIKNIK